MNERSPNGPMVYLSFLVGNGPRLTGSERRVSPSTDDRNINGLVYGDEFIRTYSVSPTHGSSERDIYFFLSLNKVILLQDSLRSISGTICSLKDIKKMITSKV